MKRNNKIEKTLTKLTKRQRDHIEISKCKVRQGFQLQTTSHLRGQRTGVRPAREASASGSMGAILVPGLCGGQSAQVRVWTTEASSFWDRREPQSFWVSAVFGLQTSVHLPGQRTGVRPAWEAFASGSAEAILVPELRRK